MSFKGFLLFFFFLFFITFLLFSQTPAEDPFYHELLKEGKQAFNNGNYKEAIEDFKISAFGFIDNRAKLTECYVYLVICFFNLKDIESARFYDNEIKNLGAEALKDANLSDEVEAKFLEISHYLSRFSSAPKISPRREDEIKVLQEAIKKDPRDMGNYYKLGSFYMDSLKYKEAIELWEDLSKIDSSNPYPYLEIGKIYRLTKDYKKALQYLEKASSLLPNPEPELHYELGVVYFEMNNHDKAYGEFSIVRKINENFKDLPKYWKNLEEIFEKRRDEASSLLKSAQEERNPSRKMTILRKAKELDPFNREIFVNLANLLVSLKKEKEAIAVLDEYLMRFPSDIELLIYNIELLIYEKDFGRALIQVRKLENLDNSRIDIPYLKGKIYFFQKRYREAVNELAKLMEKDRNYKGVQYYYNLSLQKLSGK